MASRHSARPRNRSRPAVRPVAHRCASSCVCGPPPGPLSIPAERHDVALTIVVRHGVAPPTAPVRPPPAIRQHQAADDGSDTAFQRPADASRCSSDCPHGHASSWCEAHDTHPLVTQYPRRHAGWHAGLPYRVGGRIAPAVLPQHRAYGSVPGAADETLQSLGCLAKANESTLAQVTSRDRLMQVASASMPPGTSAFCRCAPRPVSGQTAS